MTQTYMNLVGTYDMWLVFLSYAISAFGSYTALQLAGHVIDKHKKKRLLWIAGAAIALGGGGIWSMHFIAMLAYKLPIAVNYDITITVASLIAAIVVTGIGLYIVTGGDLSLGRLCTAGAFVGVGVGTMHYIGMEAMRMDGDLSYNPLIFVLSFVVAIVVATVGLFLLVSMRGELQRIVSALVIAFAVSGMHYTAMFGTTCRATILLPGQDAIATGMSPTLLGEYVAGATMVILVLSLLVSFVNLCFSSETEAGGN